MDGRQIELGYESGVTLRLVVEASVADALVEKLPSGGWHHAETDDGDHWLNLDRVLYLRLQDAPAGIGFGND